VKDLFACPEETRDVLLAWFSKSYDNVVESLSLKDDLTYHQAKQGILNYSSNYHSPSRASSKNFKPQHEANPISLSYGNKDKNMKKWSSSYSNSGDKECNRGQKLSPGTASSHI
jgi:hypothetical protein